MVLDGEKVWAGVGLVGQGVFTARFLVQWLASERKRETVIPEAFWWLSLCGGLVTLTYAIHLGSLSFSMGQGMGLFVYARNLMLIGRRKRRAARQRLREAASASAPMTPATTPHDTARHRVDAGGRSAIAP
ncbi:MAG: lipid-A-disaccharide synthase N-terminal domain-containing protein [Isosphaeraceae bacterium]